MFFSRLATSLLAGLMLLTAVGVQARPADVVSETPNDHLFFKREVAEVADANFS
jgi:hypothetical protein